MISMAYDQKCETLRFVSRNESFRFRCFWRRRRLKRNGAVAQWGGGIGKSGEIFAPKALEVGAARRPRPE
jgi:hypothetical protein